MTKYIIGCIKYINLYLTLIISRYYLLNYNLTGKFSSCMKRLRWALCIAIFAGLPFIAYFFTSSLQSVIQVSAQEQEKTILNWNAETHEFIITVNTDDTVNYSLIYLTDHTILAGAKGSGIDANGFSQNIFAGTCSQDSCTPHTVIRGISKIHVPDSATPRVFTTGFAVAPSSLSILFEGESESIEFTKEEYAWLDDPEKIPKGTITIVKNAIPNACQVFNFTGSLGTFALNDSACWDIPRKKRFPALKPGLFKVTEETAAGWTLSNISCTGGSTVRNGSSIMIKLVPGGNVFCLFINEQLASVGGMKFNDKNRDGQFTPHQDKPLRDWIIFIDTNGNGTLDAGEPQNTTSALGRYAFADLIPGAYSLCEQQQEGWESTLPNDATCRTLLLAPGAHLSSVHFPNHRLHALPKLSIWKTNDAATDRMPGGTVIYTMTLQAQDARIFHVKVIDVLSNGFTYHAGSWSAKKNGVPHAVPEPAYISSGTWDIGDLAPGDTVQLTLAANIGNDLKSGAYTDITYAYGCSNDTNCTTSNAEAVIAQATDPGKINDSFVGTSVNVIRPNESSAAYNAAIEQETTVEVTPTPSQQPIEAQGKPEHIQLSALTGQAEVEPQPIKGGILGVTKILRSQEASKAKAVKVRFVLVLASAVVGISLMRLFIRRMYVK